MGTIASRFVIHPPIHRLQQKSRVVGARDLGTRSCCDPLVAGMATPTSEPHVPRQIRMTGPCFSGTQPLTQIGLNQQCACFRFAFIRNQNPLLDHFDEPIEIAGVAVSDVVGYVPGG